jgi:heme exporter protein C
MPGGHVGFYGCAIAGVAFLRKGDRKWDIVGMAAVEISLVFFFIAIVSGSIWARGSWGTWWTWDPRLTTAAIVELVYAAYLMLRQGIEDPDRRARFGAVYAVLSFISVPLTFISIRIFRTIHPVVIGGGAAGSEGSFDKTPSMLQTFIFSLLTFSLIFANLLWHRIRLGKLADETENLRLSTLQ